MTDERYVDPNSGAAPQPGSFAGAEATEKGFGPPPVGADGEGTLEEDVKPSAYEPPGAQEATSSVSESYPALANEAAQEDIDAAKERAKTGEDEGKEPEEVPEELQPKGDAGEEATAVESKEVELQATSAGLSEGVEPTDPDGTHPSVLADAGTPPDQPADGDGNPVDAPVGGAAGAAGAEAKENAEAASKPASQPEEPKGEEKVVEDPTDSEVKDVPAKKATAKKK